MEETKLNDIADNLLIINITTIDRLFKEESMDPLVLYIFYYKTAKWQNHNPIKANDEYARQCLHWGLDKVKKAKKRLKELELIQVEKRFDENHHLNGWYTRVNYYETTGVNSTGVVSTSRDFPLVEKSDYKILNNNNINTINNKNTINNINTKEKYIKEIEEIVDYLNKVCGTSFKSSTSKTRSLIQSRLSENFTTSDFKKVIEKKNKEWAGTDYEKYLRPETLFGNKFEGYLNEKTKEQKGFLDMMGEIYDTYDNN